MARGQLFNEARASQLRDFSGLQFANKITPTDMDCWIEFGDKAMVFIEAKCNGTEVLYGQRLALRRITRDVVLRGKKAVVIIATHGHPSHEVIDFAKMKVIEHCEGEEWIKDRQHMAVRDFVDQWLRHNDLGMYIPGAAQENGNG
jgi:hypothetical protein